MYEAIKNIEVTVPASEIMLLLVALTVCLAFRTPRLGLLIAFIGTYRWAWIVFKVELGQAQPFYVYGYFGFGVVVVVLTLLTWMFAESDK